MQPPRPKVSLPLTTSVSVLAAFGCLSGDSSTNSIVLLVPAFSGSHVGKRDHCQPAGVAVAKNLDQASEQELLLR
ncbi:hypothetical protein BFX40_17825 [Mesorhizobium sp. SEMIA 3007]|nr:hypothetical protein BFX40_17825 [Mesorhizobium sp. SEMIA 3007]